MNKIRVQITVTEKHLDESLRLLKANPQTTRICHCPVALAAKERLGDKFHSVGGSYIRLINPNDKLTYTTTLPVEIWNFTRAFDTGRIDEARAMLPLRARVRLNYPE